MELELQVVVCQLMWVLRIKFRFSTRVVTTEQLLQTQRAFFGGGGAHICNARIREAGAEGEFEANLGDRVRL